MTSKDFFNPLAWNSSKNCARGSLCEFSHTLNELQYHSSVYKTQNCEDQHEGNSNKTICIFAHSPAEIRTRAGRLFTDLISERNETFLQPEGATKNEGKNFVEGATNTEGAIKAEGKKYAEGAKNTEGAIKAEERKIIEGTKCVEGRMDNEVKKSNSKKFDKMLKEQRSIFEVGVKKEPKQNFPPNPIENHSEKKPQNYSEKFPKNPFKKKVENPFKIHPKNPFENPLKNQLKNYIDSDSEDEELKKSKNQLKELEKKYKSEKSKAKKKRRGKKKKRFVTPERDFHWEEKKVEKAHLTPYPVEKQTKRDSYESGRELPGLKADECDSFSMSLWSRDLFLHQNLNSSSRERKPRGRYGKELEEQIRLEEMTGKVKEMNQTLFEKVKSLEAVLGTLRDGVAVSTEFLDYLGIDKILEEKEICLHCKKHKTVFVLDPCGHLYCARCLYKIKKGMCLKCGNVMRNMQVVNFN